MNLFELETDQGIYSVTDLENETSFIHKDELDKCIKDGSIQPGFVVMKLTVHAVFKAKPSIELVCP